MRKDCNGFIESIENENTARVAKSMRNILDNDFENISNMELDQIIIAARPKSMKEITTIVHILGKYAKFIGDDALYNMCVNIDRNAIWLRAKHSAPKKFITRNDYLDVIKAIETYEEHNQVYISALFRSGYEGIYSDDLSVVKNLRSSDISKNIVAIRDDNGKDHSLEISEHLAKDLRLLGDTSVWQRKNRFGTVNIKTLGLHNDTCFKAENRNGSKENAYRFSYYRVLRKISKEHLGYNLLPLQLYISGIMWRIKQELNGNGISLKEAFSNNHRDRLVSKIIADELEKSGYDIEVRNFREAVMGHIDVFDA